MAFKIPIQVEGEMSAFYFGTGGNLMFVSLWEWKPAQKESALENLFKATKDYVEKFKPQKIKTHISEYMENEIINKINNNVRFEDISYTQFIHRRGKRLFTQNGEAWEIMTIPEMVQPSLYFLRQNNKYLAINYLRVKGIKYDTTNPLITNSILARMGNEMLNRS